MEEISSYLTSLWISKKESDVYVILYKLWLHPASTIASVAGYERVWTYKTLQKFVEMGIIAESISKGVKHFRIPSIDLLHAYIQRKQKTRDHLDNQFDYIKTALLSLWAQQTGTPKIQLYEKAEGLQHLFQDILNTIQSKQLIQIKLFATNTFETQLLSSNTIQSYSQTFFQQLKTEHVTLTSYIADGSLIMEQLRIIENKDTLEQLPAGNNAINLFLVGQTVYIIIYKNPPIGIKLESPELAWALHFLLEYKNR